MDYLSNLELVQTVAKQIVQDRKCHYSEESLNNFLEHHTDIQHKPLNILNRRGEILTGSLFRTSKLSDKPIIIYLHALGSNRLEALHILSYTNTYDVMSFDFSGSGKSQGKFTTFGLWEREDIDYVLKYLGQKFHYQHFILWGRSMGAVSAAQYLIKYPNKNVKCLILDSAFSSFQKTAVQLACNRSSLPQFMLSACVIPLKKHMKQNYPFDPFEVNLIPKIKQITCKMVLIYSQNDTVVHCSNSKKIAEACLRQPQIIEIQENHNTFRKSDLFKKVFGIIQDTLFTVERRSKSRGIRLYSNSKDRKGIQLNKTCQRLRTQQTNFEKRQSMSRRRNSIFSSIQTQVEYIEQPKKKKICVLPTFYQSQLLMLNSIKNKSITQPKQAIQNKQNTKFGQNLINKVHINAIRKNRFGLK